MTTPRPAHLTRIACKLLRTACLLITFVVVVVSFTPLAPFSGRLLSTAWYEGDADVLIVLGASMLVSGTGPDATLGHDTYLRCVYASWYVQKFHYPYVVVTGYDGLGEAMAAFLRTQGVDPKTLLVENKAENTFQNGQFVKRLLENHGLFRRNLRLALLTSDYHSRRAGLVFEHCGLHVHVIPVPDLQKQADSPAARWIDFFTLSAELGKYITYSLNGRL